MLKNFDQIVKDALENYLAPHVPDWDVFYDLLQVEQDVLISDDDNNENSIGTTLADLDFTTSVPAWDVFEGRLDELNMELDKEFDQTIGHALDNIPATTWGTPDWDTMSAWLDDLEGELDAEFDQTVGEALVNIPESTWKEQHWQMLSSRLDELNDKPRLLMMKVIEAAAILLILMQLSSLYSDYQLRNGHNNYLTGYLDQFFNRENDKNDNSHKDIVVPPNSFPSTLDASEDLLAGKSELQRSAIDEQLNRIDHEAANQNSTDPSILASDQPLNKYGKSELLDPQRGDRVMVLKKLPVVERATQYIQLFNHQGLVDDSDIVYAPRVAPQLENPPNLIAYSNSNSNRLLNSTPRLGMRDINLLTTMSADSILSSIPTLQVIRPRLHSSMEVGALADATNVEIQGAYTILNPKTYEVPTFNPGLYFRYKIQYQNMFGSLGGDYVNIKYDGLINKNELAMVSLPVELGYNIVNEPSFRMYFSGGIAGRFVPVAKYSPDPFNQASAYHLESNRQSNGLFNNGPFEINSYLSGRVSVGLDINVNKKTSINLRFSHDVWLKGRGIGYNLDKFKSSHLGIGTNFHF